MGNKLEEIEQFKRDINTLFYVSAYLIDEWISLRVDQFYYSYDTFVLKMALTKGTGQQFSNDDILDINNEYFYVDKITASEEEKYIQVEGRSLLAKTLNRIINSNFSTGNNYKPEQIASLILEQNGISGTFANRDFNQLQLDKFDDSKDLTGQRISNYQNSYGVVMEAVENLMKTYDFGVSEKISTEATAFFIKIPCSTKVSFFKGRDQSKFVQFDSDFDNLSKETYETSNYDEKNIAYVFGSGDGNARKNVVVGSTDSRDIDLKELYVDARDLQPTVTDSSGKSTPMADAQYLELLRQRGNEKLLEHAPVLQMNGVINIDSKLFVFGDDYRLGDRVKIVSSLFGVSKDVTITALQYVWDEKGFKVTPTFGNESPTLIDLIKRG
ncbi:MAG: siphovirus ReqiPepy6 Gp37-like family protein [Lactobacillaceae bacterium]|jgi:hypothetical protein|nr:siphovirus ReqiPepy6 Gp37-like family protein [Lactobacillaceae bacterium]